MSSINEQYLTVQQVMERIGARNPTTVHRMIRKPDNPTAPLIAEKVAAVWLVNRASVDNFLRRERRKRQKSKATRGYPRGRPRGRSCEEEKTPG